MLLTGEHALAFALACGLIAFTWFFGLPYQMGLLAARDATGRADLAGLVMSTGGMALGPTAGALLFGSGGYRYIGLFAAGCYLVALILALTSAASLKRQRLAGVTQVPGH